MIDSDDVDRVVQTLMAEHEALEARATLTTMCGVPAIAVMLDVGERTERAFLLDADGDDVPVMGSAQQAGLTTRDVVREALRAVGVDA